MKSMKKKLIPDLKMNEPMIDVIRTNIEKV